MIILDYLRLSSNLEIAVVAECDIICSHCPHIKNGICQKESGSAGRIRDMDMLVLEKLGLRGGTKAKGKDIFDLVNARLGHVFDVDGICGKCEWGDRCSWYLFACSASAGNST